MRILFVAMANSIHTARWIGQLCDQEWEIHLFPVDNGGIHPELRQVIVHDVLCKTTQVPPDSVRIYDDFWPFLKNGWPFPRGVFRTRKIMKRLMPQWGDRSWRLAQTIRRLKPDIIHSLEMQHSGYLTLESCKYIKNRFPKWIYSSWGSDIFFFGRQPEHKPRIRAVLKKCNYYIADCYRDVPLAKKYGFEGETLGVYPVGGGYDCKWAQQFRQQEPVSERKVIALKGYHDDKWAGRAMVALEALQMCSKYLNGYEIEIYLASPNVRHVAEYVSRITKLAIRILPYSSYDEILKLMGRARIAIGVNITDGTPSSLIEAMMMGAFPIQSDTISTAEWIIDGENGFLVPAEDPEAIALAVCRAMSEDDLVNQAAKRNNSIITKQLDRSMIKREIIEIYKTIHDCN